MVCSEDLMVSFIPAAMVAVLQGPEHVVFTAALFLALHILEGYILLPLIQQRAVHLPPALTLVVQAAMGELLGLLGVFVAAPLTVAAMVLVKILYVEDTLGDHSAAKSPTQESTALGRERRAGDHAT
jgi:predicted PurR-regulated permease PerM